MALYHIAIGLALINRQLKADQSENKEQSILFEGQTPLTYEQAYQAIREKRNAGFCVWPPCNHVGPDGTCLGHDKKEEI